MNSLVERVSDRFNLTPNDRGELLPSESSTVIYSRVQWAKTYLKQAGLIESPARGVVHITAEGRSLLESPPPKLTNQVLSQYPAFREFMARSRRGSSRPIGVSEDSVIDSP